MKNLAIQEGQIQIFGFKYIKYLYKEDAYLKEAYEVCINQKTMNIRKWEEYMVHIRGILRCKMGLLRKL